VAWRIDVLSRLEGNESLPTCLIRGLAKGTSAGARETEVPGVFGALRLKRQVIGLPQDPL